MSTKGKLKPVATIVAQFAANVEVDCIKENGKIYLPVMGSEMFDCADNDSDVEKTTVSTPIKKDELKAETKAEVAPKAENVSKTYTEKELIEMPSDKIYKILKDMGVEANDYDGKNTNKKLRDLYLAKVNGTLDAEETSKETEAEEETAESPNNDVLFDKVTEQLDLYDDGKINRRKLLSNIMALTDADVQKEVSAVLDDFEDNDELAIEYVAKQIVAIFGGEVKESSEFVSIDELEKGDKVSVWWDDENKAWFDGVVTAVGKEGVTVHYDEDDTEDTLDPKINTKIKLID